MDYGQDLTREGPIAPQPEATAAEILEYETSTHLPHPMTISRRKAWVETLREQHNFGPETERDLLDEAETMGNEFGDHALGVLEELGHEV